MEQIDSFSKKDIRICVVGDLGCNQIFMTALKKFGLPIISHPSGVEILKTADNSTFWVFAVEDDGLPITQVPQQPLFRVIGATAFLELVQRGDGLSTHHTRPLFSLSMLGAYVCFTGFRKKDQLLRLVRLVQNMGGKIQREINKRVTHLIANTCEGEKYRYASTFRIPILSEEWVNQAWERRKDLNFLATSPEFVEEHKLKFFSDVRACFVGFSESERKDMATALSNNGGMESDVEDCTHLALQKLKAPEESFACSPDSKKFSISPIYETPKLILPGFNFSMFTSTPKTSNPSSAETSYEEMFTAHECETCEQQVIEVVDDEVSELPQIVPAKTYTVKAEWLWKSVQDEARVDESQHLIRACQSEENLLSPLRSSFGTPRRKRKPSQLLDSPSGYKRRSAVSDAGLLSINGSLFDCSSVSTETLETGRKDDTSSLPPTVQSPRHQVFLELLQTEKNYVGILHTIMTLIRAPLEIMTEEEGPLLDQTELKTIFGNLPPIYELHFKMLEDLCRAASNWNDSISIGNIILRYKTDMIKAYPPFVNFFEQTKEMLNKCDKEKPRFHAFLKVCQSKPECGRQTLCELFIRPVQRLPSISLLLGDLLKHTSKSSADYGALEAALAGIREVMTYINEDKRRMEACMDIFSIFNDIENCPPHLVSSYRGFVARCEVVELSNELSGKGDSLVLFLFSDVLEVCKRRSKSGGSVRSPNSSSFRNAKHFKHVRLIPLSDIKKVFNVQDKLGDDEKQNVFALKCRSNHELKEKQLSFTMAEDYDKCAFLQTLCRQLANTVCKADPAYFLSLMEYSELDLNGDAGFGTLSKAFRRTKTKIGRTFSFNKTPNKLKRAVSTMMSPFGNATNITPATQLAQMRLASCTTITDLASSSASQPALPVEPRRKTSKVSSLSASSFRRL